jgi:hypothetical protein
MFRDPWKLWDLWAQWKAGEAGSNKCLNHAPVHTALVILEMGSRELFAQIGLEL